MHRRRNILPVVRVAFVQRIEERKIGFGCRVTGRGITATIVNADSRRTKCSEADRIVAQLKLKLGQETELHVLNGDCGKLLSTLAADSIQCCVTSPPYWGLRDYDHPDQIGAEPSPDLYVRNLVRVFAEVRRVLKDNGTLWLNVGDGYARNGGTGKCGPNAVVGNTKKLIQKRNCKVPSVWGLKDRDLMGLPWRVAFALQEDGWILRSKIAWIKKPQCRKASKIDQPTQLRKFFFLQSLHPIFMTQKRFVKKRAQIYAITGYWGLIQTTMVIRRRFLASWRAVVYCLARANRTGCSTPSAGLERRALLQIRTVEMLF
jgi:hypothetical protein